MRRWSRRSDVSSTRVVARWGEVLIGSSSLEDVVVEILLSSTAIRGRFLSMASREGAGVGLVVVQKREENGREIC
jgi:hypothetical protein